MDKCVRKFSEVLVPGTPRVLIILDLNQTTTIELLQKVLPRRRGQGGPKLHQYYERLESLPFFGTGVCCAWDCLSLPPLYSSEMCGSPSFRCRRIVQLRVLVMPHCQWVQLIWLPWKSYHWEHHHWEHGPCLSRLPHRHGGWVRQGVLLHLLGHHFR